MIEIGTLCVKTTGRDGNNYCIVVDKIDDHFVLIDGNVRRKKCNISHLEPIKKLDVKKGASTEEVREAMKKAKMKLTSRRPRTKEKVASKEKNNGKSKK